MLTMKDHYTQNQKKKKTYLGRGDNKRQFVTVSTHQFSESFRDLGSLVQTTVLGEGFEEVLSDLVGLTVDLQGGENTFHLGTTVNSGVFQEALEGSILLNGLREGLEVLLNSLKGVLASSSGVKGSSITTIKTEEGDGGLT